MDGTSVVRYADLILTMLVDKALKQGQCQPAHLRVFAHNHWRQLLVVANNGNLRRSFCEWNEREWLGCHTSFVEEDKWKVDKV